MRGRIVYGQEALTVMAGSEQQSQEPHQGPRRDAPARRPEPAVANSDVGDPLQPSAQPPAASANRGTIGQSSPSHDLTLLLLNVIGEGVGVYDRLGVLFWGNDLLRHQSGGMLERISGACRQFDRDHPLPPPGVVVPPGTPVARAESVMADADRYFEVIITPLAAPGVRMPQLGASPLPEGSLTVVVRDETSSRRLQHKINAIDLAGAELVRFEADLVRRFNAHERLKLLETKIVRFAEELLNFDHFAIRLLDERTGKLELVIGHALPRDFDSFVIRPGLEGYGISGYVAASGRSYVCADTTTDPLYLPGVEGARSSLTIPLRLQDKVIGIMNAESEEPGAFTEEDRQLGEIFARYIAVALHMLDLLVVERSTTNQTISGRVATELSEPLEDIAHEVEELHAEPGGVTPATSAHLERIRRDIESIRGRIRECAAGPSSLLGVEQALADTRVDPLLSGKRVLIADDDARIRKTIGDVLTLRGAHVTVCPDGGAAIVAVSGANDLFDLILSDIRMPDHNGYEIFAAAQRTCPKAPVILMTGFGYDPHHSIVRASQEGLQSVLFKPFQVERLLEEVRKALTTRR